MKSATPSVSSLVTCIQKRSPVLFALVCCAIGVSGASAATITVTSPADSGFGSLRQALLDSADGGTIDFSVSQHAITLTSGELLVDKSVTISGPGAANLAVDGSANGRVFHISPGKSVTIAGLTIRNGKVSGSSEVFEAGAGGGIYNDHGTLTLISSSVSGNEADMGAAIYNNGTDGSATLTLTNSTVSGNGAAFRGGGIFNDSRSSGSATVTVTNSTVSGNAANFGGGINNSAASGTATLTVSNSTLSDNSAEYGGAVWNDGDTSGNATVTLANSTFSGNSGTIYGGAIYNATSGGSALVTIGNTILNAGGAAGVNIYNFGGTVTSNGYNISSDSGVTNVDSGTGSLSTTGDQMNTDPKVGPLADNGGPTQTHALLLGSPAIDKGKDLSGTGGDQRGRTRPFDQPSIANAAGGDGADIGAFELITRAVTNNNDSAAGSLRQVLADSLDGDLIYFDPSLDGQTIALTTGELLVDKSVNIFGPGAKRLAVSGSNVSRVFHIGSGKTVGISALTIRNGRASGDSFPDNSGGGIYNDHGVLAVTNSRVTGNSADLGGGICSAGHFGSATLTVTASTISGNSADSHGGGIFNSGAPDGDANLTIINSTVSGNSADFFGGGIYNHGLASHAAVTVTNSTLSGNSAFDFGGGIYNDGSNDGSATVTLTNSTLSRNSSNHGGSIYNNGSSSGSALLTIGHTILHAGTSAENLYNNAGTVTSQNYNLSSDAGVKNANGGTGSLSKSGDQLNTNPKLAPLANNGGPTLTHALQPGSPAINNGNSNFDPIAPFLTTDQRGRGFNRVRGRVVDIGAYESGTPHHLSFRVQPSDTVVGRTIPAVEVRILDAGNVPTKSTADVTLSIGTNTGGATLSGTRTVAAINGTATFTDVSLDKPGTDYTLLARSTGLAGATSRRFNVLPRPRVEFSSATYRVQETQPTVTLTLVRHGTQSVPATVHIDTSDGTATAGSDYIAKSKELTIPAGAATKTFIVGIVDDGAPESRETFKVKLTAGANTSLGAQKNAAVTIIDKDDALASTIEFSAAGDESEE